MLQVKKNIRILQINIIVCTHTVRRELANYSDLLSLSVVEGAWEVDDFSLDEDIQDWLHIIKNGNLQSLTLDGWIDNLDNAVEMIKSAPASMLNLAFFCNPYSESELINALKENYTLISFHFDFSRQSLVYKYMHMEEDEERQVGLSEFLDSATMKAEEILSILNRNRGFWREKVFWTCWGNVIGRWLLLCQCCVPREIARYILSFTFPRDLFEDTVIERVLRISQDRNTLYRFEMEKRGKESFLRQVWNWHAEFPYAIWRECFINFDDLLVLERDVEMKNGKRKSPSEPKRGKAKQLKISEVFKKEE